MQSSQSFDIHQHLHTLPFGDELKKRIAITYECKDSDAIPKVEGAGSTAAEGNYRYQLMHNGLKVIEDGYNGPGTTEIIRLLKGHHEPQEEKAFHEILKYIPPQSKMLELGSYWAYYSLWFHKQIAGATNYMIEPDPSNIEVGKRNFAINSMPGSFFNYYIGSESSPPTPFHCESDNQLRMTSQICVDDFIEQNQIDKLDMLLADIQGYELKMLQGAIRSIQQKKIRFLFLSTHHHLISDDPIIHHRCEEFLRNHGAHIIASHTVSESYSGDGLIVASLDPQDRNIPKIELSKNHSSNSIFREAEFDLQEAREKIQSLQALNRKHQDDLNSILHSKAWKLGDGMRKIYHKFKAV